MLWEDKQESELPHQIKQIEEEEEEDTEIKLKRSKVAQSKKTMVENWVEIQEAWSESENGIWCKTQRFRTPKLTGRLLHLFFQCTVCGLPFRVS